MMLTEAPDSAGSVPARFLTRFAEGPLWSWALGFGLVLYLGLEGGGYDPLVHDQVGVVVWWVLLATVAVGALPRRQLEPSAWCALALLAALTAWTALSLIWTESSESTVADLARTLVYLGVFALGLFSRGRRGARQMVAAVGAAVAAVAIVALASRLHPSWFPEMEPIRNALPGTSGRLSHPLNYWNGLAALIALGLPLLLHTATSARSPLAQFLAAAALPAMALTLFYTLSRGGIVAALVALAVYFAFTADRLRGALGALIAAGGSAILILAAAQRDALQDGLLTATADGQRTEIAVLTAIVCLLAGLAQVGAAVGWRRLSLPSWHVSAPRQRLLALLAVGLLAALAVAGGGPDRASRAWGDFKEGSAAGPGATRLGSLAGQGRYQFWSAAVEEGGSEPLTGTGAGTYRHWWARNGSIGGFVRDAHSLYLQTFGELGLVGLALLLGVLGTILIGGGRAVMRSGPRGRPQLAAALAGCAAFCVSASFDWVWQIAVLPAAMLLLASVVLTASPRPRRPRRAFPERLAFVLVSAAAIVAISIPLTAESLLRESQSAARAGDLPAALAAARTAAAAQPGAAAPRLQEALLLEEQGSLEAATEAAEAAVAREPTNWRTWLVLSRLQAQQGRAGAAVRSYRKARSLNPLSPVFASQPGPVTR